MRWTRAGHDDGRARLPFAGRSPGTRRRTLGLLGIAGLSAAATVGFGASALASPSPADDSSTAPAAASTTTATVALSPTGATTVKSGGTVTFSVKLSDIKNAPIKTARLTLARTPADGAVSWTDCAGNTVSGSTCVMQGVNDDVTAAVKLTAPKYKKDTHIAVSAVLGGTGADGNDLNSATSGTSSLTVKKVPTSTSSPTPTKTAKPRPTPTKSHSKKPSAHPTASSHARKPSSHPRSTPRDNGHVPVPTDLPTGGVPTSGLPSVPNGSQSPFPFDPPSSTPVPNLPTPGVSPDGPVRTPNVADPQKKATGLVRSDAVSVPAAAAAAFIGLGAGTLITRAVRRRGLWHPIGRHRD